MTKSRRVLRALIARSGAGDGPTVASTLGLDWEATSSVSTFLDALGARGSSGPLLISFGIDEVDAPLAERIGNTALDQGRGLLFCAPRASLEWAVLARRLGAGVLLREPLQAEELEATVRRLVDEPAGLDIPTKTGEQESEGGTPNLVGTGAAVMGIVRAVAELGDSQATVLITGESGTGKELVARALHWASPRRAGPFVAINCAALPEALLESEFFGHEKGAFTGAIGTRMGRFERAAGGTLFLDEVGDMSLVLQAKLLRALEEREIERLGGQSPIPVDVRILAATNRSLEARVQAGEFREDLFFRIAVARIHVPPLRERPEDLPDLTIHFVRHFSRAYGRTVRGVTDDALRLIGAHSWPGNVRELKNVLDLAVLRSRGGWVRAEDLAVGGEAPSVSSGPSARSGVGYPPNVTLDEVERDHISRVLEFTGGAMAEAAEVLGIHRNTLTRKVERFGLSLGGPS